MGHRTLRTTLGPWPMEVGSIELSAISDGTFVARPGYFGDHIGWLFDLESKPLFPRAIIWFGSADWRYFIERRQGPPIQDHVHEGFRSHAGHARLRPIDRDSMVAPGITAVRAPGHTPGPSASLLATLGGAHGPSAPHQDRDPGSFRPRLGSPHRLRRLPQLEPVHRPGRRSAGPRRPPRAPDVPPRPPPDDLPP